MTENNEINSLKSDELWLKIISEGVEDRVEVNQRMLIDKMLARYSSDFVVYRELIQNSDDAQSSSFTLEITCDPSTSTFNYQSINKTNSSMNQKTKTNLLEDIGQLFKNSWAFNSNSNQFIDLSENSYEINLNNCLINEIRTINNGNIFSEDDWKRVITIAEGNTNVDAIGQFGVGFFSVFSYSEKPIIQSGKHCLAFVWKNGKSLTTFRKELSLNEQTLTTSIILSMKKKFILQTKTNLQINDFIHENRIVKAKKNSITNEIFPILDLTQLKAYFTKVLSFTKYINQLIIQINGQIVFQINKTRKSFESNKLTLAFKRINSNAEHNLLHFNSFKQTEQIFSILNGPSITLYHIDVQAKVIIDKDFHQQIENLLKKSLPSTINIQFLFPSNNIFEEEQWKILSNNNLNNQLLKGLIPFKFHDEQIFPSGQIFIGLATNQSTGIGMHICTHLIPTIERENIDLQDPYISIWNEQLLVSCGKILRFIYDQTILDTVNNIQQQTNQRLNHILSSYAFQSSAPNKDIGRIIVDGFFSSDKDILVPVKRSPSDNHLSLIPSTEAFLSNCKHIQSFLPVPLVPFEIGKNNFFKILKHRQWIEEITNETILVKIHQSILSFDELIGLLRWLCTNDINKKSYIKQILSKIHYRETRQTSIIKLENIEYYDILNLCSLPLPSYVLPSNIAAHISREDLQKRLFLSQISIKNLIEFYIENEQNLFLDEKTSTILLSFICQHWNQFNNTETNKIKNILSNIKCIPTSEGMKLPNESYIRSSNLSSNLSIIKLNIQQIQINDNQKEKKELTEYSVSIEFLKSIGCRSIYVPISTNLSEDIYQTNENFIENLLKQRKYISENDLNALKNNQCIIGTTLELNNSKKDKYKASDLHFPSVANRLKWNQLLIIDWPDIDPLSPEYSFLKELGVREVPHLDQLIYRINEEHQNGSKIKTDYKLPNSLLFFAENFQQYYSKLWKNSNIKIPFLPSSLPDINQSKEVILTTPDFVYKESNPICPYLLLDVIRCFSQYFHIDLLGIKSHPSLSIAFQILMEKRNELLNIESASKYFSYFNKLDGLNKTFIQNISNIQFIPLPGKHIYVKPSEVFIRSKNDLISSDNQNDDIARRGLIDYVDYGYQANSFLINIGVGSYPSAENLANLLIQRQENYFKENNDEILSDKLRIYTNCLKELASISNIREKLNIEPLRTNLITKEWCLAYQFIEESNDNKKRIFKICKPSDIYLDDDHQSAIDLKPLCAPDEPQLIKLYEKFGSKWLSETVQRTLIHKGKVFSSERTKKLNDLIHYRLDMLFVNNRGEIIPNIDEKRIQLLKNHFFVYETEQIQCQLTFQNKKITLNSKECSSCALEYDKKNVILYIDKDISTVDYIDISTELTRFVYKKPLDTLVHSISDKLASPLETLKRRGIPVDRLLKTTQQQQPIQLVLQQQQTKTEDNLRQQSFQPQLQQTEREDNLQQQQSHNDDQQLNNFHKEKLSENKLEEYQLNEKCQGGFFQSLKDLLIGERRYSSPSVSDRNNSIENISSRIERDHIDNFGEYKHFDDNDINQMIRSTRSYTKNEFYQKEYSKNEINNSCEFIPQSNMIRYSNLFNDIPLYIDENITINNLMIDQAKQLALLLSHLAKYVFNIPVQTMHLFRDIHSARIAFNSNGALFFNLRYFEQVFGDDLKKYLENNSSLSSSSNLIVRRIVNFYFMVTCHELSHNIDSNHDLNFINRLERVSVQFMDAKDAFLSKFSFK